MLTAKSSHSTLSSSSRKIHHQKQDPSTKDIKKHKEPIFFFIDPFHFHRIYGDYVIPIHSFTTGEPIHFFKAFMSYKSVAQIHIREKGVVLQFNDASPDYITPLGFLRDRLDSMGLKVSHELAEFLPEYYRNFENLDSNVSHTKIVRFGATDPTILEFSTSDLILKEVDRIFDAFKEDLLFISVRQFQRAFDNRLNMLCFKNGLKECLIDPQQKENMFDPQFRDHLMEVFACETIEVYINELEELMKNFTMKGLTIGYDPTSDFIIREVPTIFGKTKEKFRLHNIPVNINGWNFHVIIAVMRKDELSPFLTNSLDSAKTERKNDKRIVEQNNDWAKIYHYYFPQKDKSKNFFV